MSQLPLAGSNPTLSPTATLILAVFTTPTPTFELTHPATPSSTPTATATETATLAPSPTNSPISPATSLPEANPTRADEAVAEPPTATATTASPEVPLPTPAPTPPPPASELDFVLRWVRLRTNEENSWDGALGPGQCGSDHSIYVHVADAQENLLNDILIGDKYGNFEVPTGVDGAGKVRILVWSAAMEVAVMGHKDGTRYTSDFTPPLSTLDEQIPLDWLQQAGYCNSPEDCQWRVENNQLCRGHYSYDVVFQRTW